VIVAAVMRKVAAVEVVVVTHLQGGKLLRSVVP